VKNNLPFLNQINSLSLSIQCRSQWPRSLKGGSAAHACWDCGFESRRGHACLSVVSVVCCQVEVFATGWSLVQRSPTEYICVCVCVSKECDREAPYGEVMNRNWVEAPQKFKKNLALYAYSQIPTVTKRYNNFHSGQCEKWSGNTHNYCPAIDIHLHYTIIQFLLYRKYSASPMLRKRDRLILFR